LQGLRWFIPSDLNEWTFLASGIGVLLVLLILPGGLGQAAYRIRDRYLRFVARRRGIVVPSLVADLRVHHDEEHAANEVDLLSGALDRGARR